MQTLLEINNWDQLVDAKSDYTNLRILVTHYNNTGKLVATKISIVDYETTDVYFSGFATIIEGTIIPESAKFTNEEIIAIVNSYSFNVAMSQPIQVCSDVLIILNGLYEAGYRYIYKDYCGGRPYTRYGIYATKVLEKRTSDLYIQKMPEFLEDGWDWCLPNRTYPIENILETGTVDNGN